MLSQGTLALPAVITFSWNFPLPLPRSVKGLPTNCQHSLLEGKDTKITISF